MAVFKCKMCGGTLEINNETVAVCEYCGTKQTLPKTNDDVISNLFNRANNLRLKCEFDKAAQIYEKIVEQDDSEAEAHWGIVLCKYGIEYVEDPKTLKRIPTCHRTLYEAVLTDVDYLAAIENADAEQKELYIAEAKIIDELQKNILNIVSSEEPFDVFLCYKETDENGKRTIDSAITNDIYYQLTQEGFKVFYAPITLEDKLGHEYEPYIFAALNSAKVMLVVGTKPEYFDSIWVRNEWSRFFKSMKNDRSKLLIPCYRDMDAYELPNEFAHLQAQDMSKIGFIQDIIRGIGKTLPKNSVTQSKIVVQNNSKKPSLKIITFLIGIVLVTGVLLTMILLSKGSSKKTVISNTVVNGKNDNLASEDITSIGSSDAQTSDFEYDILSNGVKITKYTGIFETVTVPSQINGANVISIGDAAFQDCRVLKSITLPDTIKTIGDDAFWGCDSLTSIVIPDSVIDIGNRAFCGCSSLNSIILPNSITNISLNMLEGCSSLTSLTIPNSVQEIDNYAFSSCSSLTTLTVPNGVTRVGLGVFMNCSSITSITIPNSVTGLGVNAFRNCSSLKTIYLQNESQKVLFEKISLKNVQLIVK